MKNEPTSFLHRFIEAEERDASALVSDFTQSARSKISEGSALRREMLARYESTLATVGRTMAEQFECGARLFAFGHGGRATDADGTVELFRHPPHGRPLAAISLVDDRAVMTALANEVGFDLVFSRQIIAHAKARDIAIGFSTSGNSANVLRGLVKAKSREMLTIGLSGSSGGAMAVDEAVDHCFVVTPDSVDRIQQAQGALTLRLWSVVQEHPSEGSWR